MLNLNKFLNYEGLLYYDSKLKNEIMFERGDQEDNIQSKYGNPRALSSFSLACGQNTIAGIKGFYWSVIEESGYRGSDYADKWEIALSTILRNNEGKGDILFGTEKDFKISNYWTVGDIVSIHADIKYLDYAIIFEIDDINNRLIFENHPSSKPILRYEYDITDNAVYVLNKPDKGLVDFGMGAIAVGENNKAINYNTFVTGQNNIAKGQYSASFGKNNKVGYCSMSSGRNNIIDSDYTYSIGAYNTSMKDANASLLFGLYNTNHSTGKRSIIGGENNHNYGANNLIVGGNNVSNHAFSFIVGQGHISTRNHQALVGSYSNSSINTLFAVGNGTEDLSKNAFEVLDDAIIVNGVTLTSEQLQKILDFINSIE